MKFVLLCLLALSTTAFAQKKDFVVTIKTAHGDMVAILFDETPKHKANFIKLAREGFYDSLLFHRVIKDFMIQGGDPDSKRSAPGAHLGAGGPGYTVDAEINPKFFHHKGVLSAARLGDQMNPTKASSGSQFYIVQGRKLTEAELKTAGQQRYSAALQQFFQHPEAKVYRDSIGFYRLKNDRAGYELYLKRLKPAVERQLGMKIEDELPADVRDAYTQIGGSPHLDGQYTVFGRIIKGLEVIDKIADQPKDGSDRPVQDIRMTMEVRELSKKKIQKLYGYQYDKGKK